MSGHGPAHDAYALAQDLSHMTAEAERAAPDMAPDIPDMPDHALPDSRDAAGTFMPYTGMEMPDDIPL